MRLTKNKTTNTLINASFVFLAIVTITKATVAYAAGYIPLEPLTVAEKTGVSFSSYLNDVFRIGIGLAGVLAVLMIVLGGIGFIGGASNPSARSEAKNKITNAIFGLILASASWLILYTINPELLNTSLLIKTVSNTVTQYTGIQSTESTGGYCLDGKTSASKPSTRACGMTQKQCDKRQAVWQKNGFIIAKGCYPYVKPQSKAGVGITSCKTCQKTTGGIAPAPQKVKNVKVPKITSCKVC